MQWRFYLNNVRVDEPIGWADMGLTLSRHPEWHGVFASYSLDPLRWICDAYDILRNTYEVYGISASVLVLIEYTCDGRSWEVFVRGRINGTTLQFLDGENQVAATIEVDDPMSTIRNLADRKVDLLDLTDESGTPIPAYANSLYPVVVNDPNGQTLLRQYIGRFESCCIEQILGRNNTVRCAQCVFDTWISFNSYLVNDLVCWVDEFNNVTFYICVQSHVSSGTTLPGTAGGFPYWEVIHYNSEWILATLLWTLWGCPAGNIRGCLGIDPGVSIESAAEHGLIACTGLVELRAWVVPELTVIIDDSGGEQPVIDACTAGYFTDRIDQWASVTPDTCSCEDRLGALNKDGTQTATAPLAIFQAPADGDYHITWNCQVCYDWLAAACTERPYNTNEVEPDDCPLLPGIGFKNDWKDASVVMYIQIGPSILTALFSDTLSSPHAGDSISDNVQYSCNNCETIAIDQTVTLNKNDEITIWFVLNLNGYYLRDALVGEPLNAVFGLKYTFTDCCVRIERSENLLIEQAQIPAIMPHEAFNTAIAKLTSQQADFYSAYFARPDSLPYGGPFGCGAFQAITSGFQIRGYGQAAFEDAEAICGVAPEQREQLNRGIVISFKDLFDGFDAINCLGMGIEQAGNSPSGYRIRVEPREYFYDQNVIAVIDAGDKVIRDMSRKVDTTYYFERFEIGYQKWESETINGSNEFNTKRTFKTLYTNVKNSISELCKFIASGYSYELTRRKHISIVGTEDWRNDEDIFIICLESYAALPLYAVIERGIGGTPANVVEPASAMNWRVSPWGNMLRWIGFVGAAAFPIAQTAVDWLTFSTGSGNYNAEGEDKTHPSLGTACNVNQHAEDDPISTNAGRILPFFRPETVEFEVAVSLSQFRDISQNPRGLLQVNFDTGTEYYWIKTFEYRPNEQTGKFTLLPKL